MRQEARGEGRLIETGRRVERVSQRYFARPGKERTKTMGEMAR